MASSLSLLDELQRLQNLADKVIQPLTVLPVLHFDEGKTEFNTLCRNVEDFKENVSSMRENINEYNDLFQEIKVLQDESSEYIKDCYSLAIFKMQHGPRFQSTIHNASDEVLKTVSQVNQVERGQPKVTKKKTAVPCYRTFTNEEYMEIPKHVRKHVSLQQFNDCLKEVNLIWKKKYEFLAKPNKSLSLADQKKRCKYLEDAKPVKGTPHSIFFTDDDISAFSTILKSKKQTRQSVFLCLRHVGKMKETRVNKLTRYAFLQS